MYVKLIFAKALVITMQNVAEIIIAFIIAFMRLSLIIVLNISFTLTIFQSISTRKS